MVAKAHKTCGGDAAAFLENHQHSRRNRSFSKPSWLLCTIADLDERVKTLLTKKTPKENTSDSFAARANSYYHERPQLLELLQELYNGYLSLADRYCQALTKNNRSSRCILFKLDEMSGPHEGDCGEVIDSDTESSLSFQPPVQTKETDVEMIIADLVMKTVECEIVLDEVNVVEKRWSESSRKIELQKNLLDVLESERLILLNDNTTLGYRVSGLVEENKGLASESLFLKRKAAELARCVLKTREDYRVCMLSRKIEDLQEQIYGLEKRNKEYYEMLVRQEEEKRVFKGKKSYGGGELITLEDCLEARGGVAAFGLSKCFSLNMKKFGNRDGHGAVEGGKGSKLWGKVKKFDLMLCRPGFGSGGC